MARKNSQFRHQGGGCPCAEARGPRQICGAGVLEGGAAGTGMSGEYARLAGERIKREPAA